MNNIKNKTVFYISNDFERALGLETLLPNFHIICIDNNEGIKIARDKGIKIFCLEEELKKPNPIFRNSNYLLKHQLVQKYIHDNTRDIDNTYLMFFKIAPNIEYNAKMLGYKVLNTTSELNHRFEHKLSQYEKLKDLGYFPKTKIMKVSDIEYDKILKELNRPFVIQYDRGHTGSSTIFINSKNELDNEKKLYPQRECKVSEYINGEAWTINGCITRFGIAYGGLNYQITGIPSCTTKEGATVGNDWTREVSKNVEKKISEMIERIGKQMFKAGYRGMFGLDLVINKNDDVYLIEVNARQPASTGMHTKLMLNNNHIPLYLLHILEFIHEDSNEYIDSINKILKLDIKNTYHLRQIIQSQNSQAIKKIDASQLIIRNTNPTDTILKGDIKTGVYEYINNKLIYRHQGYCIDQIDNRNQLLILAQYKNRIASSEIEIARIQSKGSIINRKDTEEIVNKIKENQI